MGKVKAWYMKEIDDGYVNEEVQEMRSMEEEFKAEFSKEVVRDEWDLWATHDGEGDN